jgi:cellulose biosynthesis protein BcsQ
VLNIAATLAGPPPLGLGKRVALVDFDGQCNLTSFLLPDVNPGTRNEDESDGSDDEANAFARAIPPPAHVEGEPVILQAS